MRLINSVLGFIPGGFQPFLGPRIPWTRPSFSMRQVDPRTNPATGGGRRLVHPYLDDIVYPENPSQTLGFDFDALRTIKPVLTQTEGGTALVRYPDFRDDVQITEVWDGQGGLALSIEFVRLLYQAYITPLPEGDYLGWHCPDKSPYFYFIEIIDLKIGNQTQMHLEEVGTGDETSPYMITEPVSLIFKLVSPAQAPAGVLIFLGA